MKIPVKYSNLLLLTGFVILNACSSSTPFPDYSSGLIPLYEQPSDWKDAVKRDETIKNYSKYLTGKKIFIDAGHGGEDRKNKSLSGKIIEADVNLRVAKYLKKYLESAGALVLMSRYEDIAVDLRTRSELANNSGADIFISIHHNASGSADDYSSDYTSTFYHSNETNYDYEPCNRDLARYIQRDLAYVMRNSGGLGSFDGTYSDFIIYPKEGFALLRKSKIPAVLVECGFHTSRFEEIRLGFEEFNEIQAWGIFRGIGKYLRAGIPIVNYDQVLSVISKEKSKLILSFEDKNGIDEKTIKVFCDSLEVGFSYNKEINILEVSPGVLPPGDHTLRVIAANKNKNYSFPYYKIFKIE
jgi:N-acetylmuramoyl-L-alanine amidase